ADVPTTQYRSANTLPREVSLFRHDDGQIYAASAPSPELKGLRDKLTLSSDRFTVGSAARNFALPAANGGICEIEFECDAQKADSVSFVLSNKAGNRVVMNYNPVEHTFSMDRVNSGITDFSESFPTVTVAPTFEKDGKANIRIFIDRSSIELFGNGGRFAMTNLVFPEEPYTTFAISASGSKARISNLKVYSLK
ncbi:MAG: GH32 C-terminal domain-containing protein, partial [Muribaculaceae bacterium]|nr:GH32 C-terminal domain-containing protein [Muribaculaceae bacterium]